MTDQATEKKIIEQIEHYFGDFNLNRDRFLLRQIRQNSEGWVPISVLLTFNRLSAISSNAAVIAEAVAKSEEGLVEVSVDKKNIRRHPERPMPELDAAKRKDVISRTAYVKGFPITLSMDELLQYFADFKKVGRIHLNKYFDGRTRTYKFEGSVLVTFQRIEQAQDFIEKSNAKYNGKPLLIEWQEEYIKRKI